MTTKLAALLLLTSTTAFANTVASDGVIATHADEKPTPSRFEGRFGMLLGGSDVGDADGFSMGVSAGAGYRIGDLTLRGQFQYYRVGDSEDEMPVRRGRASRVSALARYSFANNYDPDRDRKGLGIDFWGEAGMGVEHVEWREGGVLNRPSGELAVGFELDGFGKLNERTQRRRHVGYFMDFRTLLAEGPPVAGPVMCGGPCDKATRPSRIDISMFFELGLHWGR
jgi:hypothetical protein